MAVYRLSSKILKTSGGSTSLRRYGINPFGFSYTNTSNNSLYAFPTGMLITGRGNRLDASFASARAGGCLVYAYFDLIERPDTALGGLDDAFYMGNPATVPLWPFLTQGNGGPPAGQQRVNFAGNTMTDITTGSSWVAFAVNYIQTNIMAPGQPYDGVFLDVQGDRLYSTGVDGANWTTDWGTTEQNAWTDGSIDAMRLMCAARDATNLDFDIVTNNVWNGRGDNRGLTGEQYINGICSEHHLALQSGAPSVTALYAQHAFNTPQAARGRKRFLSIASTIQDVEDWKTIKGVTHISNACREVTPTGPLYAKATVPPFPFYDVS